MSFGGPEEEEVAEDSETIDSPRQTHARLNSGQEIDETKEQSGEEGGLLGEDRGLCGQRAAPGLDSRAVQRRRRFTIMMEPTLT